MDNFKFVSSNAMDKALDVARHYKDMALSRLPELKFDGTFETPLDQLETYIAGELKTSASLDVAIIEASVKFTAYLAKIDQYSNLSNEDKESLQNLYASQRGFLQSLGIGVPEKELFPAVEQVINTEEKPNTVGKIKLNI